MQHADTLCVAFRWSFSSFLLAKEEVEIVLWGQFIVGYFFALSSSLFSLLTLCFALLVSNDVTQAVHSYCSKRRRSYCNYFNLSECVSFVTSNCMGRAVRQFEKEWSWVEEEKKRASLEDRLVSWVWCAFALKYSLKYSLTNSFEVWKNC